MTRTTLDRGKDISGADFERPFSVPLVGTQHVNSSGRAVGISRYEVLSLFDKGLATTITVDADRHWIIDGTGTELQTQATKGGINLKSQVSTPADGDTVFITPDIGSILALLPIRPASTLRFDTIVALNTITALFASVGFNENNTDVDPTGTAGDGAMFVVDPTGEFTSTLTAAERANWALAHKVNGADTFAATSVPVLAGVDYELVVQIGTDLKPKYYINGELVGTGPVLTSGDTLAGFLGLELTATPGGQKDMDVRFVSISRGLG